MTEDQRNCDHDIAWCPGDQLDGMCRKCNLYVMKPDCMLKTAEWFDNTFGKGSWERFFD